MRRKIAFALAAVVATVAHAQDNSLLSVLRGDVLEWDKSAPHGEFSIRAADSTVSRCRFDEKTYLEKDKQRVASSQLAPGVQVEAIIDRSPSAPACYARAIRVTRDEESRRAVASARLQALRASRSPLLDSIFPRGNLTFGGVIVSVGPETMLVHTRTEGQKSVHLRVDTKYLNDGRAVTISSLQPNMRVFIRAGKNLDNEIEAYQVVWGEILTPQN